MTLVDIIVLAIICLFGIAGAKRGLVWELFSIAGIALGLWIPFAYNLQIGNFVGQYIAPGRLRIVATVAALLFTFAATYVILSYMGYYLRKLFEKVFLGWIDRLFGGFFGLVKGTLLVAMVFAALLLTPWHGHGEALIRKSQVLKWGKKQVERVIHFEPREMRGRI